MAEIPPPSPHRVAIGGVGGSGTRVGAALLRELGYYIGGDLNDALDNLWFTLLFKRRAILALSDPEFAAHLSLFWRRMDGEPDLSESQRALVLALANDQRLQHDRDWLGERAATLLYTQSKSRRAEPWGWKEPNTHIVIERIFQVRRDLRYIHFVRHPLDMAFSSNQNQLMNWGPILLSRDVENTPRWSLAYWCVAHRRMVAFMQRYPERTVVADFDKLCADPAQNGSAIAAFLATELSADGLANFRRLIDGHRTTSGRYKTMKLSQFDPSDIAYVAGLGYEVD
jgi:hypothetical protein